MDEKIKQIQEDQRETERKIKELSDTVVEMKIQHAQLMEKLSTMTVKLDNFSSGVNRGLWVLGGSFLAAIVTWITGGGLNR